MNRSTLPLRDVSVRPRLSVHKSREVGASGTASATAPQEERSSMQPHRLLLLVLTVLIMVGGTPAVAAPRVAAPAGLAHWWPANGTPGDRVGRSGRAALSGGATYGPGVRG